LVVSYYIVICVDVRLQLVQLAVRVTELFPHEVELQNLLEYYKCILEQAFKDAFPDLKREAARCVLRLCKLAPRHVKQVSLTLIQYVKANLRHKHSSVRRDMVLAFSELILSMSFSLSLLGQVFLFKMKMAPRTYLRTRGIFQSTLAPFTS
jgi:hypothetical protein